MEKTSVVASLGQSSLLLPAWIHAALRANDRLKLLLTLLQSAHAHAWHPRQPVADWSHELAAAGLHGSWLRDLPSSASRDGEATLVPELPRLAALLASELATMARPVLAATTDADLTARCSSWQTWLEAIHDEVLDTQRLHQLTHGQRAKDGKSDDSLHLLVMDLHKRLNQLAAGLHSEQIDGAQVWQLDDANDRARVAAFMRGLQRTAWLKFDHPGLETAATRDGERLLIQNDIGTSDAHVLVLEVVGLRISLTYSDLHRSRFAFFQRQLAELGAQWHESGTRRDANLNQGEAYQYGVATFDAENEPRLQTLLEAIAARIVFLIDWNRARKRLQHFVRKERAIALLEEAVRQEIGHIGWLRAGGERLVYDAMQAVGERAFRIGDRLDEVLGEAAAEAYLLALMRLATQAARQQQPRAMVADEARLQLARQLQRRQPELELLAEHAAYCEALAAAVAGALQPPLPHAEEAQRLAQRGKDWERRADHLVMHARQQAMRQPRWRPLSTLIERFDDAADALEECTFVISLAAEHRHGWDTPLHALLQRLAEAVLNATQEQVKALALARRLDGQREDDDHDAFVTATWQVLRAERECDDLLRQIRRHALAHTRDTASLLVALDLAGQLERTSDHLLAAAYGLREWVFSHSGVSA